MPKLEPIPGHINLDYQTDGEGNVSVIERDTDREVAYQTSASVRTVWSGPDDAVTEVTVTFYTVKRHDLTGES